MSTDVFTDARTSHPQARRSGLVETHHGHTVADPYRWLEERDTDETRQWLREQDQLSQTVLNRLPGRAWLRAGVHQFLAVGIVGPPVQLGARRFFMQRRAQDEHTVVRVVEPDGADRVVLDPVALDPSGATVLDAWHPDHDGRRIAYQVCVPGESSRLYVLDVDTGEVLDGPITRCRMSPVAWLPGGEAFYYVRALPDPAVPPGQQRYDRRVYLHRVGTDPDTYDHCVFGAEGARTTRYEVAVTDDGRWLTLASSAGATGRNGLWVADLADGDPRQPRFLPVRAGDGGAATVVIGRSGRFYLRTGRGAPLGRCVSVHSGELGTDAVPWREILPEDPEARLQHLALLDGPALERPVLLAGWERHSVSEITVHDAADGCPLGTIALPGPGLVGEIRGTGHEAWFTYTDALTPGTVFRWDALTGTTEVWAGAGRAETQVGEDTPAAAHTPRGSTGLKATVQRMVCHSQDGTPVRMTVVAPRDRKGPVPTVLYGYGGFGLFPGPIYNPEILAWVAAGGVYAVAHVRGGPEEGAAWHTAGTRAHKHKSFEDFHAAAEALVAEGLTTPDRLAICGESNGGLLVGAALTQRPDLYRAAVCTDPLTDMVRYERFGFGASWTTEYGNSAVAEEFGWLFSYSPYHHVRPGADYPAVLLTLSEEDVLVDPMHARKMCAALQHAAPGTVREDGRGLVLLRRDTGVGHGAAALSPFVELLVDRLSFMARHTGLRLPDAAPWVPAAEADTKVVA
ncbi:prolyl oligopeptidase family protein [Streptomyces sp. NPDC058239]|uniref:prolyl oligopeptidase family serine peptidase n=1 Tax=Streptomyces sp. NPDC058239 TaxID=3346395 RepID=UPI0036E0E911